MLKVKNPNTSRLHAVLWSIALLPSALHLAACGDDDSNPRRDGSVNDSSVDGSKDAAIDLSDAQIVGVLHAANMAEVEHGQLAATKAQDTDVIAFAANMVTAHTAADARLLLLEPNPADSSIKSDLQMQASQTQQRLQNTTDEDFDEAYMAAQVDMHEMVLDLVDTRLLPDVQSSALRTEIGTVRSEVAAHHAEAQTILDRLDD